MRIPRTIFAKDCAMTDNSNELIVVTHQLMDWYQKMGCPCAFPRFLQTVGFFHENYDAGPVSLLESELLIIEAFKPERNLYKAHSSGYGVQTEDYFCKVCGSEFEYITEQHNNITVAYLKFSDLKAKQIGKEPIKPFPYYCGFSLLDDKDYEKCAKDFYRVEEISEYVAYMTAM